MLYFWNHTTEALWLAYQPSIQTVPGSTLNSPATMFHGLGPPACSESELTSKTLNHFSKFC
jgi:hypothetical protein